MQKEEKVAIKEGSKKYMNDYASKRENGKVGGKFEEVICWKI